MTMAGRRAFLGVGGAFAAASGFDGAETLVAQQPAMKRIRAGASPPATTEVIERVAVQTMQWKFRMWRFGEGIALRGLLQTAALTGNLEALGYVKALMRAYVGGGVAKSSEEHVAPGSAALLLHEQTGELEFLEAAKKLAALHASFPANSLGARIHRPELPGWGRQIWVDCMDQDPPFLVHLARLTGEDRYAKQAGDEISAYVRALQDAKTGLFYHGFENASGRNGEIWARGNGWALMGLVETLSLLPSDSRYYSELRQSLNDLVKGLSAHQDEGGLWHTVILDPTTYLESTLAVMVSYALRRAFAADLLPRARYEAMEQRARAAALQLIRPDGALALVSDATPIGERNMYATRPFGVFPWGQGPLLLMLCQP